MTVPTNRAGLDEIAYRVGTYTTFKRAMLEALSSGRWPTLAGLVTREDDDFTIALLDAWAVVSDVLTFYSERLANESYLRTATELLSVSDILHLVGYELHPGVAANALLAYSLQAAGAVTPIDVVTLAPGAVVKSLPGPSELPQTFETSLSLDARPAYNALKLLTRQSQTVPTADATSVTLSGSAARLQKGDVLVIVPPSGPIYAEVTKVDVDPTAGLTTVTLINVVAASLPADGSRTAPAVGDTRRSVSIQQVRSRAAQLSGSPTDVLRRVLAETFDPQPAPHVDVYALRTVAHLFGSNAPDYRSMPEFVQAKYTDQSDAAGGDWPFHYPAKSMAAQRLAVAGTPIPSAADPHMPSKEEPSALKRNLRALLAFVGGRGTAPPAEEAAEGDAAAQALQQRRVAAGASNATPLDRTYPVVPNDWVAIKWPDGSIFFSTVKTSMNGSFNAFGMSGPSTLLTFDRSGYSFPTEGIDEVRGALVYLQSEVLTFATTIPSTTAQLQTPIDTNALVLDAALPLALGQRVIVSGTTIDNVNGGVRTVVAAGTVKTSTFTNVLPTPTLQIEVALDPGAVLKPHPTVGSTTIFANVVPATHGESVDEILGSGDATAASQTFTLSHLPLTYVSAPDALDGIASTLVIEVNGIAWKELPALVNAGPRDHVFITRSGPDGSTTIRFGDGERGARLPTGYENVHAYYRYGTGGDGTIAANQLILPITRPLSLGGVTNPIPSGGGVDPEDRVSAQRNGPAYARTADRIVTLQDFADAARVAGGVSDARAEIVRGTAFDSVVVTISTTDGSPGDDGRRKGLQDWLRANSNIALPVRVAWFTPIVIQVSATIAVDPAYRLQGPAQAQLLAAVTTAVATTFAVANRTIGTPLNRSDVIAAIASVSGVVAVVSLCSQTTLNANAPPTQDMPQEIPAAAASIDAKGAVTGAAVVTVDATTFAVTVAA